MCKSEKRPTMVQTTTIMSQEKITVESNIKATVEVDVDLYEVIATINKLPTLRKWNYVGYILNNVELSNDIDDITDEQKSIIIGFLKNNLKKLSK